MSRLSSRMDRLEVHSGMHASVYAVYLADIDQVEILGTKEAPTHAPRKRLRWDAFATQHPYAEIVLVANSWVWEAV